MKDLDMCATMAALGFNLPRYCVFRINDSYRESYVFDGDVLKPEQFWLGLYLKYCAVYYSVSSGANISLAFQWGEEPAVTCSCQTRRAYETPMSSREFFRMIGGVTPTKMPLDWTFKKPTTDCWEDLI